MSNGPAKKGIAPTRAPRVPNAIRRNRSREAVLDAAEDLFVKQGYTSTTVDQIAKAAGLTKGAIYFHFEDKASVLLALIERAETRVIMPLLERLSLDMDPADKLIEYVHYWARVELDLRKSMFLPILMSLEFVGAGDRIELRLQEMYEKIYAALVGIVKNGQRSGSIQSHAPPREQAAILIAMMDGMILEWLRRQDKINGPAVVRGLRGMLLHGLLQPLSPRKKPAR